MDYRGYGLSDGWPSTSNLFTDAITIFDALPLVLVQYDYQPERVYVMGRSLGSAAALAVAHLLRERLAGLIIESGFAFTQPFLIRLGLRVDDFDEEPDGPGNGTKIAG